MYIICGLNGDLYKNQNINYSTKQLQLQLQNNYKYSQVFIIILIRYGRIWPTISIFWVLVFSFKCWFKCFYGSPYGFGFGLPEYIIYLPWCLKWIKFPSNSSYYIPSVRWKFTVCGENSMFGQQSICFTVERLMFRFLGFCWFSLLFRWILG